MNFIKRFGRGRRSLLIVSAFAAVAMVVALAAVAAPTSPSRGKSVRAAGTVNMGLDAQAPADLFTLGHARINAECGGTATQGVVKVRVTAVGGDVMISSSFWGGGEGISVLNDGDTDALIVLIFDSTSLPPKAGTAAFAVFDDSGPSFSGTAGVRITSTGCVITAQAAG